MARYFIVAAMQARINQRIRFIRGGTIRSDSLDATNIRLPNPLTPLFSRAEPLTPRTTRSYFTEGIRLWALGSTIRRVTYGNIWSRTELRLTHRLYCPR